MYIQLSTILIIIWKHLQAHSRDAEIVISRNPYNLHQYSRLNHLSYIGKWDVYPINGKPRPVQNFFTIIKPFDEYIWGFVAASVVSVASALIVIDWSYSKWNNISTEKIIFNSNTFSTKRKKISKAQLIVNYRFTDFNWISCG